MNNWELVIGIEIHIELNTNTKMFSPMLNNFDSKQNYNVSNIDLAYPGSLPLVNKGAIIRAIKLAKALNMTIDPYVRFDRKNYFYPDLPKGFQITQQFHPIGSNGFVKAKVDNVWKDIAIERIHMEEDTAKAIHKNNLTYLNYNRAGIPLIEIVSNPVMHSAKEAAAYVDAIRQIVLCLNISDAKMNEGSLRTDINISIRKKGTNEFNSRVEIKNLNSISNVEKAINFEFQRQINLREKNLEVLQETRRFDEQKQETVLMRKKTDSVDYKYFPEPNIPTILIPQKVIDETKIEELPYQKEQKYLDANLNNVQIQQLINNIDYALYFEKIGNVCDLKKKANLFFSTIIPFLNESQIQISDLKITLKEAEELFKYLLDDKIDKKNSLKILDLKQKNSNIPLKTLLEKEKLFVEKSNLSLEDIVKQIFTENKDLKETFSKNFERNKKFLIGQIMKKTMGKANISQLDEILKKIMDI